MPKIFSLHHPVPLPMNLRQKYIFHLPIINHNITISRVRLSLIQIIIHPIIIVLYIFLQTYQSYHMKSSSSSSQAYYLPFSSFISSYFGFYSSTFFCAANFFLSSSSCFEFIPAPPNNSSSWALVFSIIFYSYFPLFLFFCCSCCFFFCAFFSSAFLQFFKIFSLFLTSTKFYHSRPSQIHRVRSQKKVKMESSSNVSSSLIPVPSLSPTCFAKFLKSLSDFIIVLTVVFMMPLLAYSISE